METLGGQKRPSSRRKPLGDGTHRANMGTSSKRAPKQSETSSPANTTLPHHESLVRNGHLTVRNVTGSPENKRLSAVTNEDTSESKRDSQVSTTSTNASSKGRRRKTHIGPWQLGSDIGMGCCGKVRKVRHSVTGEQAAVKIISKALADKTRAESLANLVEISKRPQPGVLAPTGHVMPFGIEREVVIMKLLEHPNVVRLYDVWENRNELYLIMEYVDGGELFEYIEERECLYEDEAVWLFRQMVAALLHSHRLGIHHRDLKPENILVDRTTLQVKLADFGMAALQPKDKLLTTPCGSMHYAAPEVFKKRYDGSKVDVWSLGVILYVMLTGTTPFSFDPETMKHDVRLWYNVLKAGVFPIPKELSKEAKDLLQRMLVPNSNERISMEATWAHPLVHKYETEWGESADTAKIENWIGPRPVIENWNLKGFQDIDREILRNLRTLWHSVRESVLVDKLLNKEPNQEKYFYSALLKHREEHLENYVGGPDDLSYSTSDHHYIKSGPEDEMTALPRAAPAVRTKSQFSILNDEHLHSRSSVLGPSSSTGSYDPFKASKDAKVGDNGNYLSVTVHREASKQSGRSHTTDGTKRPTSIRIEALKKQQRRTSTASSSASVKASSHLSPHTKPVSMRSVSRSSMASSVYKSSPPIVVKPSIKHKRAVNFSHLRKNSAASAPSSKDTVQLTTPQKHSSFKPASTGYENTPNSSPTPTNTPKHAVSSRKEAAARGIATDRTRKTQTQSQVIDREARKVSTELENLCDAAFNRSSTCSSRKSSWAVSHSPCETPPSSISNRLSGPQALDNSYLQTIEAVTPSHNASPEISDETPNTFMARELAETRKRLVARYAQHEGNSSPAFSEVLAHIDALLQPSKEDMSSQARRVASAPERKQTEYSSQLPVISEEARASESEPSSRPVTSRHRPSLSQSTKDDPIPRPLAPRSWERDPGQTIRVIDAFSSPNVAPLVIRKASDNSGSSQAGRNQTETTRYCRGPGASQKTFQQTSPTSPIFPQHASQDDKTMTVVSESKTAPLISTKKSWWRRKHHQDAEESKAEPSKKDIAAEAFPSVSHRVRSNSEHRRSSGGDKKPSTVQQQEQGGLPGKRPGFLRFLWSRRAPKPQLDKRVTISSDFDDTQSASSTAALSTTDHNNARSSRVGARSIESTPALAAIAENHDIRDLGVQRNWLARFLHIKPASKILCFNITRGCARAEIVRLLRSWRPHGLREIVLDRERNFIFARLDPANILGIKGVEFVIELFVVLQRGERKGLSVARMTQRTGAASSFRRVAEELEARLGGKGMLVVEKEMRREMEAVLMEGAGR